MFRALSGRDGAGWFMMPPTIRKRDWHVRQVAPLQGVERLSLARSQGSTLGYLMPGLRPYGLSQRGLQKPPSSLRLDRGKFQERQGGREGSAEGTPILPSP